MNRNNISSSKQLPLLYVALLIKPHSFSVIILTNAYFLYNSLELGVVQILLHNIVHVDWLRFCALRNKMDDKRKGNAGRNGNRCGSEDRRGKAAS